jgi:hypothetical protein
MTVTLPAYSNPFQLALYGECPRDPVVNWSHPMADGLVYAFYLGGGYSRCLVTGHTVPYHANQKLIRQFADPQGNDTINIQQFSYTDNPAINITMHGMAFAGDYQLRQNNPAGDNLYVFDVNRGHGDYWYVRHTAWGSSMLSAFGVNWAANTITTNNFIDATGTSTNHVVVSSIGHDHKIAWRGPGGSGFKTQAGPTTREASVIQDIYFPGPRLPTGANTCASNRIGFFWARSLSNGECIALATNLYAPRGIPLLLERSIPPWVFIPAAAGGTTIEVPTGDIDWTGYAPSLALSITPAESGISWTGYAPTVSQNRDIEPGVGALSWTGYAPSLAQDRSITPGVADIDWTGYAPSLALSITPAESGISWTGYAPVITAGLVPDAPDQRTISIDAQSRDIERSRDTDGIIVSDRGITTNVED